MADNENTGTVEHKTECCIGDIKIYFEYDTAGSFMADWRAMSAEEQAALKAMLNGEIEAGRWSKPTKYVA
jgi:hypothetical protein